MQAIQFAEHGAPLEVLQTTDLVLPDLQRGQVLVRMLCSPVNPSDLLFIRGNYTTPAQLPQVPGFEGAGIVEAAAGGVKGRFFRGKRVVVLNQQGGTWGQKTIVPDSQIIPVPASFSDAQAATSFVNPMTAWIMIHHVLKMSSGQWLIQTAAGSIVGRMVDSLSRQMGFQTINVVRSEGAAERCRAAGVAHVVLWDDTTDRVEELNRHVNQITNGAAVTSAIDSVSGNTGAAVLSCLSHGARYLAYGTLSGHDLNVPTRHIMSQQISINSFWLGHFMKQLSLLKKVKMIRRVQKLIGEGILNTPIASVCSLQDFRDAIPTSKNSNTEGRTLIEL